MKKIKGILILVTLLSTSPVCFGQYFQKLHDYDSTGDFGWNIFVQDDGNYFVTTGAYNNTTSRNQQGWLNISQDGDILSNKKIISSSSFNYYQGLLTGEAKKLSDGGYLIPLSVARSGRSSLGMMRLDAMLDTVFTRFYTDTTQYFEDIAACAELSNGDLLIGGYTALNNGALRDSALIIRTDNMGNIRWRKEYKNLPGFNEWPCILSLQEIDNNRILVGAMSTHLVYVGSDQYGHNTPWFMIVDSVGEVVKDTVFANTSLAGGGRIYKDIYGGYFHAGAFDSMYTIDPTDQVNFPEYIAHLNDNFEIDWIRNFGTWDGHKYIVHIEQVAGGNFQLSGNVRTDTTWSQGWAAQVDHNGWTIWDNKYLCDDMWSSYLVDFDVRQDGSIIFVGAARNDTVPSWRGQEMWLVSVDANGCLVPGCDPTIVKPLEQKKGEELLVYPNPTTGELTIQTKEQGIAIVTDLHGRTIATYNMAAGKNPVDLSTVAAGVYLLQYRSETGTVNVRLVKE